MSLAWCEAEVGLGDARVWLVNPLTPLSLPKHLVGRLIGKQGRYVSFLKQTSGAKIYISTLPYTQNIQVCHIEGQWQPLPGFYDSFLTWNLSDLKHLSPTWSLLESKSLNRKPCFSPRVKGVGESSL